MGVLGDSISAATLADVPIPDCATPEEQVRRWNDRSGERRLIYSNKRRLSWGSGSAIRSQYRLLQQYLKSSGETAELQVLNFSHPGDSTRALPQQARKLADAFRRGGYSALKYVVLTIGANDACDANPHPDLASIRASILGAMTELAQGVPQREPIRVLLAGVPRIAMLGVPEIQHARTAFGLECRTVRNGILHFCNRLTTWSTQEGFLAAAQTVDQVNAGLQSAVREVNSRFPAIEMVYSDGPSESVISLDDLAVDCFHPSSGGQERISLEAWEDQPWFRADTLDLRQVTPASEGNPGSADAPEWIAGLPRAETRLARPGTLG